MRLFVRFLVEKMVRMSLVVRLLCLNVVMMLIFMVEYVLMRRNLIMVVRSMGGFRMILFSVL